MRISAPTSVAAFEQTNQHAHTGAIDAVELRHIDHQTIRSCRITSENRCLDGRQIISGTFSRPASSMTVDPFSAVRVVGVAIIERLHTGSFIQ